MFTDMQKCIEDAVKRLGDVFVLKNLSKFRVITPKMSKKKREIYLRFRRMMTLKMLHTNLRSFSEEIYDHTVLHKTALFMIFNSLTYLHFPCSNCGMICVNRVPHGFR